MTSSWKSCVEVFFRNWSIFNWVCKIHRTQLAENNSKKLIIILKYKKIFQKINHFDQCIKKYIKLSISQELPLLKNDDMSNNSLKWFLKKLAKFFQVNFRKGHEILGQLDKSIKSYIKMFEAAFLLGSPCPDRVKLKAFRKLYFLSF